MNEGDSEQIRDNFEIEFTDLDADDSGEHGSARRSQAARLSPQLRAWARQRRRPLTATSAFVVMLVVLLMLASTTSIRGLVARDTSKTVPTPVLNSDVDLFYVDATPPWGRLQVDGHIIAQVPIPGVDIPLRLSRGKHVFTWRAAPFREVQCTLSVPSNYKTDTCAASAQSYGAGVFISIVMLTDMLNNLPLDQQNALINTTQQALDALQSSDTVQPGEQYVVATQHGACQSTLNEPSCYAIAKQPLQATLRFQLDANPNSIEECVGPEPNCAFLSQNCHLFCPGIAQSHAQQWMALVAARSLWTFATRDGRILEQSVPDNLLWDYASRQPEDESLITLEITWDSGGWHVTIPGSAEVGFLNPVCAAANSGVQMLQPPVDAKGNTIPLQWQFASSADLAAGCVGIGTPNPELLADVTPTAFQAPHSLHRFGVVLAANAEAHRLWPQLPLIDAHEQQLTQQLVNLLGGP